MPDQALIQAQVRETICALRQKAPLVHNITNFVVMEVTANALLAVGASPLMAHEPDELDDLLRIASALVLNIGTLSRDWIVAMEMAGALARKHKKPVLLDPVGAGASRLRTETALRLLETIRPEVLRGNASEIMALAPEAAGASAFSKGVDSTNASAEAAPAAFFLAGKYGCAVSVSGQEDLITDGKTTVLVRGGTPLITRVTGMGCSASAITGACLAVAPSPLIAAAAGMAIMSSANSSAAALASGPGSFLPAFLDALYHADPAQAALRVNLAE